MVLRWVARHGDRVTLIDRYIPVEEVPESSAQRAWSSTLPGRLSERRRAPGDDDGPRGRGERRRRSRRRGRDGETGLLVAPRTPRRSRTRSRGCCSTGLADRMGEAGRNEVLSGSSWATVAERVEAALLTPPDRG